MDSDRDSTDLTAQRDAGNAANDRRHARDKFGQWQTMSTVNQVLNKVVSGLGLEQRLKEQALMSLWPAIAGDALADKSRPLFIDAESFLVLTVKDGAVGQELSLRKSELLKQLRVLARGIGVEVRGLRFTLKHFHSRPAADVVQTTRRQQMPSPTEKELDEIALSDADLRELANLRSRLEQAADRELCERMISIYEKKIRVRHWRILHRFPRCPRCSEPSDGFHGKENVCRECYFESMSQPAAATEF